jgi:hypothetical protein
MAEETRSHVLVVGGTGMLRDVVRFLAKQHDVTVVARDRAKLEALVAKAPTIYAAPVDYGKTRAFEKELKLAIEARGPFTLAVAWIHSDAPEAAMAAAKHVQGRFFHVLGSEVADPATPDLGRRAALEELPDLEYHEVVLGFVRGERGSRWLTNEEIVRGVLTSLAWAKARTVVGTVVPWSAHP